MNKKYVIRWKSTVNGRAGKGTKLFAYDEAEQLVRELNQEYPQIVHEVVEAGPPSEPATAEHELEAQTEERLQLVETH